MGILCKKFNQAQFGSLTTLVSEKTGKVMFVAKEVAELWGHTNSRKAIKDAGLREDEILVLNKNDNKSFFEQLSNQQLLSSKTGRIQLISESGLYKLALNSKKPEAEKMRHWIASEVLPSIRKTGQYSIGDAMNNLGAHQNISVQKLNSREMNAENYKKGGVPAIVEHNTKSCQLHTGKTPKEIKEFGKCVGLKSSERTSAKEVLRRTNPAMACAMSLTDSMVKQGHQLEQFAEISKKHALPLFDAMLKMGAIPAELNY